MSAGRSSREKELRCFCNRNPLLATYGVRRGKLFVHVKVYKQHRIFGEVFVEGGKVMLRCRECLRVHTVNITQDEAKLSESTLTEMNNFCNNEAESLPNTTAIT